MKTLVAIFLLSMVGLVLSQCNLQSVCYSLDESVWINNDEVEKMKNFTVSATKALLKQNPGSSFSAISFTGIPRLIQPTTTSMKKFESTLLHTPRRYGYINLFAGLDLCINELKKQPPGPRIIIFITAGYWFRWTDQRQNIRDEKIGVLSIDVGNGVFKDFIKATATFPEFYFPTTFDNLFELRKTVAKATCDMMDVLFPSPAPDMPAPTSYTSDLVLGMSTPSPGSPIMYGALSTATPSAKECIPCPTKS